MSELTKHMILPTKRLRLDLLTVAFHIIASSGHPEDYRSSFLKDMEDFHDAIYYERENQEMSPEYIQKLQHDFPKTLETIKGAFEVTLPNSATMTPLWYLLHHTASKGSIATLVDEPL